MTSSAYASPTLNQYAILFIYHKEPDICADRIECIRELNPCVPIYGLYGGKPEDINQFESVISLLDDHWIFEKDWEPVWKWKHLDKMMLSWFKDRGYQLPWDVIFEYTWDLLLTEPVRRFVQLDSPNKLLWCPQVYTSEQLKSFRWCWTEPYNPVLAENNTDFEHFCDYLKNNFTPDIPIYGGGVIFMTLTRSFFQGILPFYHHIPGFHEYRIPTIAKALGFSFQDWHPIHGEFDFISYGRDAIPGHHIEQEAKKIRGRTIFHPVYGSDQKTLKHTIYG